MSNPYQTPEHADAVPSAASEVRWPAIAIMVLAAVSVTYSAFALLLTGYDFFAATPQDFADVEFKQSLLKDVFGTGACVVINAFAAAGALVGAYHMKNLKNYRTATFGALMVMMPCLLGPCCLLGVPVGLRALIVLGRDHVKSAFQTY